MTGHLEVIARSAQHRATDLWNGVLGEIRELQLRRVAAEATTARQAWQQVQAELRPLLPVGRPDVELTQEATKVRAALETITRQDHDWRPIEELVRGRRDVEELMHATARVAPDVERLASLLDNGLTRAQSADLCIRADQIPGRETYVEERLRRQWVPAPPVLLQSVRMVAQGAEVATRTMAISAADTRLAIAHESAGGRRLIAHAVAAARHHNFSGPAGPSPERTSSAVASVRQSRGAAREPARAIIARTRPSRATHAPNASLMTAPKYGAVRRIPQQARQMSAQIGVTTAQPPLSNGPIDGRRPSVPGPRRPRFPGSCFCG